MKIYLYALLLLDMRTSDSAIAASIPTSLSVRVRLYASPTPDSNIFRFFAAPGDSRPWSDDDDTSTWALAMVLVPEILASKPFSLAPNPNVGSTFSSPSRIGRRQRSISLTPSFPSGLLARTSISVSFVTLEAREASGCEGGGFRLSTSKPSSKSSSGSRVRIDEVTSHHNVVKSFRIRQTLQVGARGLRRPNSNKRVNTGETNDR